MKNYRRFLHAKHFQSREHAPKHDFVDFLHNNTLGKIYEWKIYAQFGAGAGYICTGMAGY